MNVVCSKWKLPIIGTLLFGKKRFKELEREIPKIPRVLSKALRCLGVSGIVTRTVYDSIPVTVEYEVTRLGKSLAKVLDVMVEHHENMLRKEQIEKHPMRAHIGCYVISEE